MTTVRPFADRAALTAAEPPTASRMGLPLLYAEDFESGKAEAWEFSDPTAWKVDAQDGRRFLCEFVKTERPK